MSEASRHTPGPWQLHWPDEFAPESELPENAVAQIEFGPGDWGSFWITDHRGIVRDTDPMQRANPKADALLIAASPALLAACKAVLECELCHDERGHAYLKVPARSLSDLGAAIRAAVDEAEQP